MTKHTLRNALRDVVINETVNNLSQAIAHQESTVGGQPGQPTIAAFSLISFADAELFYGQDGIDLLREEAEIHLARDLGDEPHHRAARVADWLRNELQSSYHLLQEAATPIRTAQGGSTVDPLEELGDQIARRDFTQIARMQVRRSKDPQVKTASTRSVHEDAGRGVRRAEIVNLLAFALRIQAAGVNRRLKQDMADLDPSLKREALRSLSFFDPDPSDEALRAFEHYVEAKWPLRVYAIEPVIAQQNVADGSSRRTQKAVELVGSGVAGPARAIAGLTNDRRASEDEATIRLNPTMVGFGAGQSTFGWIFYPRLQTRRPRDGRLLTDVALLLNGRLPDAVDGDQSIEPGQRECTALIEMPNFIPKIEFVTVANWFRTSEVGDGQRSELERASVLGRKLVAAENALNRAKVEGQYRPDEYLIATASSRAAPRHDAHPAHGRAGPEQRRQQRFADLLLAGLAAPSLAGRLAWPAAGAGEGVDPVRGRAELQRPRHPRDRGRKAGQGRPRQPPPAGGHHRERRLADPERGRQSPPGYQRRHAQRRLEPPADQDGGARPVPEAGSRRTGRSAGQARQGRRRAGSGLMARAVPSRTARSDDRRRSIARDALVFDPCPASRSFR